MAKTTWFMAKTFDARKVHFAHQREVANPLGLIFVRAITNICMIRLLELDMLVAKNKLLIRRESRTCFLTRWKNAFENSSFEILFSKAY